MHEAKGGEDGGEKKEKVDTGTFQSGKRCSRYEQEGEVETRSERDSKQWRQD